MGLRSYRGAGFTLIELMVVVAVAAILLAIALPNFSSFVVNAKIKSATSDFQYAFISARSEAIKRSRTIDMIPLDNANWAMGLKIQEVGSAALIKQFDSFSSGLDGISVVNPRIRIFPDGRVDTSVSDLRFGFKKSSASSVSMRCVVIGALGAVKITVVKNHSDGC